MLGWIVKTSLVIGIVFVIYYVASSYINKENKQMDDEQLTMQDVSILPEPIDDTTGISTEKKED